MLLNAMHNRFVINWICTAVMFIFLTALVTSLQAQTNEIKFKRISIEQQLSHKTAFCIIQDRKGFIWIGTKNGLNRYDGYQFQEFKHDADKKESLSGNHIQALFEDRDGYIWVGTYEGGLNRLDPKTGNCKVYSYSPMVSNGIGSNNIANTGQVIGVIRICVKFFAIGIETVQTAILFCAYPQVSQRVLLNGGDIITT